MHMVAGDYGLRPFISTNINCFVDSIIQLRWWDIGHMPPIYAMSIEISPV